MTIDRTRLPIRRQAFGGVANRTLAGFGNPSTFGGPISTPSFSRVADDGLRYTACHVTALCSPCAPKSRTSRG